MTFAERRELEAVAGRASRPLVWKYHPRAAFTMLKTGPCPFVTDDNRCGAHDVKPFNCRRFACLRSEGETVEFYDAEMLARMDSADGRAELQAIQAAEKPWALAHGWKDETR